MRWISIAILSLLFAVAGWYGTVRWTGTDRSAPPRSDVTPAPASQPAFLFAGGIVEGAQRESLVQTEVSGRILSVRVQEGDTVRAGEIVAELESDLTELRLREAQAQLAIATAERHRIERGAAPAARGSAARKPRASESRATIASLEREGDVQGKDGSGAADDLAIANARVTIAEAAVQRGLLALEKMRLRALIGGIVTRVTIEPGDLVSPNSETGLLAIVDRSKTRVRAFVEEFDARSIAPGQPAVVSPAGHPELRFPGIVVSCAPSLQPKSHLHRKPGERFDIRVREALIELQDGSELLLGAPVEVFLKPVP